MTIDKSLIKSFTKVTERAAFGASAYCGKNDKIAADKAAVDEMRNELNKIDIKGKIVIGEGELDEAPMLYINEKVGTGVGEKYDIAVDPLEGTNFAAKNLPNALSVLAATKAGMMLNAPETYMEKIAVGPNIPKNLLDLDFSIEKNIELLAKAKSIKPEKMTACILKRPRHDQIVKKLKKMNVKIHFIDDGDVSGAILVGNSKKDVDIYLGIGGGPEGVLAAAALKCLDCQMQTRLVFQNSIEEQRAQKLGIKDLKKKYYIEDMVKGDVIFCATGVTNGELVNGIKKSEEKFQSETLVLHESSKTNKIIKNEYKK